MNILVCSDVFTNGGLETNIITFSEYFISKGHNVYICTGEKSREYLIKYKQIFTKICYLDNTSLYDWNSFHLLSAKIQDFVFSMKIDVAIVHPFNSFFYAVDACIKTRLPYVLFFHGPASINIDSPEYIKEFRNLWMKNIALKNSELNICVSKESYELLKTYTNSPDYKITTIYNPIPELDAVKIKENFKDEKYFFFASRVDDDKYESIITAIRWYKSYVLPLFPTIKFYIAGNGNKEKELIEFLQKSKLEGKIILLGYTPYTEVLQYMSGASVVIGMGRVCLEGLTLRKETILAGYDGIKGFVNLSNVEDFAVSNFSGRGIKNTNKEELFKNFKDVYSGKLKSTDLFSYIKKNYSIKFLGKRLLDILTTASKSSSDSNPSILREIEILETYWKYLGEKNKYIELGKELDSLKNEVQSLDSEKNSLKLELVTITKSRSWKVVSFYYKVLNKILKK